jgi:type I restriction enzyme M protein
VILLPENLFYNTTAPGIVMVLNRAKRHPGEVLLVNASLIFVKGKPKNELTDEQISQIHTFFSNWRSVERECSVVTSSEIASNDYTLSPSRYVAGPAPEDSLPLGEAVRLLREAEVECAKADAELWRVIADLGIE